MNAARESPATPRPAAPWYVHPSVDPAAWQRLREGGGLAFAVVNVENGPGAVADPVYADAVAGCRTPLVGYIDLDYGRRRPSTVLAEAELWAERYAVTSVLLDQVPTVPQQAHWSLSLLDRLRGLGVTFVALNPGAVPHPEHLAAADVTCVFEGSWAAYRGHRFPDWLARIDPARAWHLLHSTRAGVQGRALRLAGRRGAGFAWATAGRLPDPWKRLQEHW